MRRNSATVREKSNESESASKVRKVDVTPLSMTHSQIMGIMNQKRARGKAEI
jgi:hypothetical protein